MDLNNGYGINTSIGITEDGLAHPIIHFVEGGSPAALNGIRRGDVILELNDEKIYPYLLTAVLANVLLKIQSDALMSSTRF